MIPRREKGIASDSFWILLLHAISLDIASLHVCWAGSGHGVEEGVRRGMLAQSCYFLHDIYGSTNRFVASVWSLCGCDGCVL
ncbi:hypothetical protein F5X68DRAFT_529 [Plectosphaerella plurivora]|uniref:Secreted protein n=1 Tax=Plectosphaerella plurivora TaxID=936078 RepID=A0A9P8VKG7_9PEZI|nr:hypothetical protein F5X68DRAFT_529 [Plectosphaerella plurivora]